jgi:serine/threonine protein kinase
VLAEYPSAFLFSPHTRPFGFHVQPVQRRLSIPTPQGLVRATEYLTYRASLGGGIIDMMNRRLRERLTEAEILQIFVDVCEGVAAMHNLRPAVLHRDLKVYPLPSFFSLVSVAAHGLTPSSIT